MTASAHIGSRLRRVFEIPPDRVSALRKDLAEMRADMRNLATKDDIAELGRKMNAGFDRVLEAVKCKTSGTR